MSSSSTFVLEKPSAFLDQLTRSQAISTERAEALTSALDRGDGASDQLDALATEPERDAASAGGRDQARLHSLAQTVKGIAESLR